MSRALPLDTFYASYAVVFVRYYDM